MIFFSSSWNKVIVCGRKLTHILVILVFTELFLLIERKIWLRCDKRSWMYKLADIPPYICGLVPTNLIFVARDYVHKTSFSIDFDRSWTVEHELWRAEDHGYSGAIGRCYPILRSCWDYCSYQEIWPSVSRVQILHSLIYFVRLSAEDLSDETREYVRRLQQSAVSWREELVTYCLTRLEDYNQLTQCQRRPSLRF